MKDRLFELTNLHSSLLIFNKDLSGIIERWKEREKRISRISRNSWKYEGKDLSGRQIQNLIDLRKIADDRYERDVLRLEESTDISDVVGKRKRELAETLQDFSIYKNMTTLKNVNSSDRDDEQIIEMLKGSREISFKAKAFMEIEAGKE